MLNRRELLYGLGTGLGSVALTALLAEDVRSEQASAKVKANPLAPKPGHFAAKAKNCIFLMMEGGPSHRYLRSETEARRSPFAGVHARGPAEVGDGKRQAVLCAKPIYVSLSWRVGRGHGSQLGTSCQGGR